jgi:hypothetical protein
VAPDKRSTPQIHGVVWAVLSCVSLPPSSPTTLLIWIVRRGQYYFVTPYFFPFLPGPHAPRDPGAVPL